MNTIKRFVVWARKLCGVKRFIFLFVSAFVFALPFMTKNYVGDPDVAALSAVFGWCGLSVLFIVIFDYQITLKRVLSSLFCFFFVFYFFVYSWFVNLYPLDFAGLGRVESIGVIVIAETLIPLLHGFLMTFCVFAAYLAAANIKNEVVKGVLLSCGYVAGEFVQSIGTFAFPWARLFVTQTDFPSLLQSASLFGSYFITFIMVFVNVLIAFSLINLQDRRISRRYVLAAVGIFAFNALFGHVRINVYDLSESKSINAVVLQGNIPQNEKWSENFDSKEVYLDLAEWTKNYRMAKDFDADIAVMPETAFTTTLFPYDSYVSEHEKALFDMANILDAELFAGAFTVDKGKSYNSILVFSPDGNVSQPYNKKNIVPFGEYMPYKDIISKIVPSFEELNMFFSDISKGNTTSPIETSVGKAACLVCFDSIFPETARRQIKNGGEFIVISTNDSWYKESAAIYQHADHAIMRAIENNVPVIRSANTGISRISDSFGIIRCETNVNERTSLSASLYLPAEKTLYTYIGDVFVILCIVTIAATLILRKFSKNKASHKK